jgi:hypothetical protein
MARTLYDAACGAEERSGRLNKTLSGIPEVQIEHSHAYGEQRNRLVFVQSIREAKVSSCVQHNWYPIV